MDTAAQDYGERLWRAGRRFDLSMLGGVTSVDAHAVKGLTMILFNRFLSDTFTIIECPTFRVLTSQKPATVERMISRASVQGHDGRWLAMDVNISPALCRIGDATFRPGLGLVCRMKRAAIPQPDPRYLATSYGTTAGHTVH